MNFQFITNPELQNVKISVITPVFNVEEYIKETLDSLISQTLKDIEIIMIDDGSSDRSPEIIEEYALKYHNIVFIKQENAGPGQARNNGLEVARGEYISFLDSDDILPSDALESMYNAAKDQKADVIIGMSLSFNKNETWFIGSHLNNGVYDPGEKDLVSNPGLLYSLGPCNKLYHRSVVKDIRFPKDIKVTEDQPFVIEAFLKAHKIYTLDKIIYNYRSRDTETNLSLSQTVRVDSVKVLNDIFKSLSLSDSLWTKYIENERSRFFITTKYYHRILSADIWPAIRNTLTGENKRDQEAVFRLFLDWVKKLDRKTFNQLPIIHRIMTYEVADRFTHLNPPTKKIYMDWIRFCFSMMDPGSMHQLEISKKKKIFNVVKAAWKRNSLLPIQQHVFKGKMKRIRTMARMAFARRVVLRLASLLPIQKKITLASNKFPKLADSFKYIYDELVEHRPGYQIKGYLKKKRNFKDFCRLYYDIATSKYVILDDYYRPLYKLRVRKGTEVIQIWHAAGAFKKFGHSAVGYKESNTREFENQAHQTYTKAVVTSKEIVPHYAEAFNLDEKSIYPLGLARTDMFFDPEQLEFVRQRYLSAYPKLLGKKVITYAPTFRGGPGQRANFKLKLDITQMAQTLGDEYVLVLKMHPSVTKRLEIPSEANDFVINMSSNDINNVLSITDILISDYSSLVFEYSLLEKPMIFYAYDLEEYLEDRGFYYEYHEFVPGPITKSTQEIIDVIRNQDFDLDKVKEFKHKFFDHLDGKAAERIVKTLIEP
ncbi:CDP-glycerol glycerophosphotransferase family protein [Bacillus sp. FJAT-27251]|uniref:bifunctional glycosyltransferase/CDP-glycerol:glycerophosphate glycerophosphotransferase n=1 Tax=Bacillus sp. FJAT-27251 TaxID=1684142 RepID=UPI0006A7BF02|nr:CDP-glycerol glycerophosphotransferase family protein [Bacillus sp. FJAT-27251]